MLSSVLRSETAVGVNIRIMRAFTAIPQIVNQQTQVIQRIFNIEQHHFIQLTRRNHDRFLIIDDRVYLMGASLKDMGAGLCAVTRMQASPEAVINLLK